MANVLSRSLQPLRKPVVQAIQRLLRLLNAPVEQPVIREESRLDEDVQVYEFEQSVEKQKKTAVRIQVHKRGIWASCSSCGIVHQLDAVCFSCGKPVCRDRYCRSIKHNHQLGRQVVLCKICENTL